MKPILPLNTIISIGNNTYITCKSVCRDSCINCAFDKDFNTCGHGIAHIFTCMNNDYDYIYSERSSLDIMKL